MGLISLKSTHYQSTTLVSVRALFCLFTSLPTKKPCFQSNTKNPKASRRELSYKAPKTPQKQPQPTLISMFGSKRTGILNPRIPFGLNLEQARELGKGNTIHQLQQNYQALSAEVTQISNDLREVLAHLRPDLGGGMSRNCAPPRGEPPSSPSS